MPSPFYAHRFISGAFIRHFDKNMTFIVTVIVITVYNSNGIIKTQTVFGPKSASRQDCKKSVVFQFYVDSGWYFFCLSIRGMGQVGDRRAQLCKANKIEQITGRNALGKCP